MLAFILGLISGIVGDAIRSIAVPATTERLRGYLEAYFPSLKKLSNREANMQALAQIAAAKSAGVDAVTSLSALHEEPSVFLERIGYAAAALQQVEAEAPYFTTQLDMTIEAQRRSDKADEILNGLIEEIRAHPGMTPRDLKDFEETNRIWGAFRRNMVMAATRTHEGGSAAPMQGYAESEAMTLERIGHLKQQLSFLENV